MKTKQRRKRAKVRPKEPRHQPKKPVVHAHPASTTNSPYRRGETDALERKLVSLGNKLRRQPILKGIVRILQVLLIGIVVFFVIDWLTHFPYPLRLAVWVGALVYGVIWFMRGPRRQSKRAVNAEVVSLIVEKKFPELQSRLISSLQFQTKSIDVEQTMSGDLIHATIQQTFSQLPKIKFRKVIDRSWMKKGFFYLFVAGGLCAASAVFASDHFGAFMKRLVMPNVKYPTRTIITDVELPELIAAETAIPVVVHLTGEIPRIGQIEVTTSEGHDTVVDLKPDENNPKIFRAKLPPLLEKASIMIEIGDTERGPMEITPIPRPHIAESHVQVTPPAYTKAKPQYTSNGNAKVVSGSQIRIIIKPSEPLKSLELTSVRFQSLLPKMQQVSDGTWVGTLIATDSFTYSVKMQNEIGLHSGELPQYRIAAIPDREPRIRILRPVQPTNELSPISKLPLAIEVEDDFEVVSVALRYERLQSSDTGELVSSTMGRREKTIETIPVGKQKTVLNGFWDNTKLNVKPGEHLRVWLEATDNRAGTPQVTKSQEFTISVITAEEYQSLLLQRLNEIVQPIDESIFGTKSIIRQLEDLKQGK